MTTTDRGRSLPARSLRRLSHPRRGDGVDLVHKDRPLHRGGSLEKSVVDCAIYAGGCRQGGKVALKDALETAAEHEDGFVWIGLHQPNADCLQQVADRFDLPPLAVEDALMAHQRPKLETYGDGALSV